METMTIVILSLCGALAGFFAAYYVVNNVVLKKKKEQILKEAETEGENIKKEKIFQAKEKFLQLKSEHEQFINEKNNQIQQLENKVKQKEIVVNQQNQDLVKKQKEVDLIKENLKNQVEIVNKKSEEYEKLKQEAIEKIESIAGLTAAEAKAQLVETMKDEARTQAMSYINDVMDEARLTASKEAKRIVINTIQRTAPETAIENAVTKSNEYRETIKVDLDKMFAEGTTKLSERKTYYEANKTEIQQKGKNKGCPISDTLFVFIEVEGWFQSLEPDHPVASCSVYRGFSGECRTFGTRYT